MNLNELQLTKDLVAAENPLPDEGFRPGHQVKTVFGKYGWNLLGYGVEGAVAEHPTKNQVLKLFIKDSPYKAFVNIVRDNPNPHFPKFSKYVRDIPGPKFSYVLMEKLQPVANADYLIDNYIGEMYVMELESEKYDVVGLGGTFGSYVIDVIYDVIIDHKDNPYSSLVWTKLQTHEPDNAWFKVCKMLSHYAQMHGWKKLDLHPKNYMLRGDTLVVIDPFGPLA